MKKADFVTLVLSTVGGILFALGMCMALIPEWNAMKPGIAMGAAGLIVLLVMVIVRRKMLGMPPISINKRTAGIAAYTILAALILGVGMCMTMVWQHLMVPGIIVGIIGIVMLLGLIPMFKGLK